jgi:hypothetical protein
MWRDHVVGGGNIFHNTLEVLDGRAADLHPAFRRGNVLISGKNTHAIAVVELERRKVVWAHRGSYRRQHDPTITTGRNLLLFDNRGRVGRSTILEYRLPGMEVIWRYSGSDERPFYSHTCGASERLPNGNTLITETDGGRAFEVTAGGEIVWEFYNPARAGDRNEFIATISEMIRVPLDLPVHWASGARSRLRGVPTESRQ